MHSFGALPSAKEIRPRTNLLLSQAYYRLSKGKIHKLPTYACAANFLLQSFKILSNKKANFFLCPNSLFDAFMYESMKYIDKQEFLP